MTVRHPLRWLTALWCSVALLLACGGVPYPIVHWERLFPPRPSAESGLRGHALSRHARAAEDWLVTCDRPDGSCWSVPRDIAAQPESADIKIEHDWAEGAGTGETGNIARFGGGGIKSLSGGYTEKNNIMYNVPRPSEGQCLGAARNGDTRTYNACGGASMGDWHDYTLEYKK